MCAVPPTRLTALSKMRWNSTSSVNPTYGGIERLNFFGALVIDGGAVANLAWRPRGIVVDYLLKTDV
jgi:hypothetical protein